MTNKLIGDEKSILFYNDDNGNLQVEVLLKDEELEESSTCAKIAQVQKEGNRNVKRIYPYYNLDMIISIGFRVNSKKAIKFRTWANKIIKDYMVQGFALNDDRFMKGKKSDQEYFKRLLEIIKLIRTSERMFYRKIFHCI